MHGLPIHVRTCIERERLGHELLELRTRGQYLSGLRRLTPPEQVAWDQRERVTQANLADHDPGAWLQPLGSSRGPKAGRGWCLDEPSGKLHASLHPGLAPRPSARKAQVF